MKRCLFRDGEDFESYQLGSVRDDRKCGADSDRKDDDLGYNEVHKAALTFRHALHLLNLQGKSPSTHPSQEEEEEANDYRCNETATYSLYAAYIQCHAMMKLTNLRPFQSSDGGVGDEAEHYQLRQKVCTQTWPGQLSLLNERLLQPNVNNDNNGNNNNNTVTCLNAAETWCDHPTCNQARCGPLGCLRCYRFLPPPVQRLQQQQRQQQHRGNRIAGDLDGPGDILGAWRECTERNYDFVSFVKCDWCSVSLCNKHINVYNNHNNGNKKKEGQGAIWYKCDECNQSSCPECISQVFPIQTPTICNVVTAGKMCGRQICSNCIWAVGKEGSADDTYVNNIPGGKIPYNDDSSQVVSIRANDEEGRRRIELLTEKEMCCSKCLRHVEFRWRELSTVFDMFGGLVP